MDRHRQTNLRNDATAEERLKSFIIVFLDQNGGQKCLWDYPQNPNYLNQEIYKILF